MLSGPRHRPRGARRLPGQCLHPRTAQHAGGLPRASQQSINISSGSLGSVETESWVASGPAAAVQEWYASNLTGEWQVDTNDPVQGVISFHRTGGGQGTIRFTPRGGTTVVTATFTY
jgi:hypothetical protein